MALQSQIETNFTPSPPDLPKEGVDTSCSGRSPLAVPLILFVITCFTTLMTGSYQEGGDPFSRPIDLVKGIPFAFTLMLILFVHEMGHYLTAQAYGVKTSFPYFLPGPWPPYGLIGTFGAFIKIRSPILQKKALLDIGAAGPFAGFGIAIIAICVGLYSSTIIRIDDTAARLQIGEPLVFSMLMHLMAKAPAEGFDIALNSVAFAGWIGLFVTSLNLLPIGQLDGGHIAYALLGKKQKFVSLGMVILLIVLGTMGWSGWYIWAAMAAILGVWHPPTLDEEIPLDFKHRLLGIASVVLFIITFMPVPIRIVSG
jgi:membrane-associated protease RseP (regulator of RpoE activity)